VLVKPADQIAERPAGDVAARENAPAPLFPRLERGRTAYGVVPFYGIFVFPTPRWQGKPGRNPGAVARKNFFFPGMASDPWKEIFKPRVPV